MRSRHVVYKINTITTNFMNPSVQGNPDEPCVSPFLQQPTLELVPLRRLPPLAQVVILSLATIRLEDRGIKAANVECRYGRVAVDNRGIVFTMRVSIICIENQ